MQNGISALEGLNQNHRRQLVWKTLRYTLSPDTYIPMLEYKEHNGAQSISLIEIEISGYFDAANKDHRHYAAELCFSFLVAQAHWPTQVNDFMLSVEVVTYVSLKHISL